MSQRARAVEAWAVIAALGASGVAKHTEQLCALASQLADALASEPSITICNDVVLNQVLVRLDHDTQTESLIANVNNSGEMWCSASSWEGRRVMRVSVCGHATQAEDIVRVANVIVHSAQQAVRGEERS